jgi:hypothetical protein
MIRLIAITLSTACFFAVSVLNAISPESLHMGHRGNGTVEYGNSIAAFRSIVNIRTGFILRNHASGALEPLHALNVDHGNGMSTIQAAKSAV